MASSLRDGIARAKMLAQSDQDEAAMSLANELTVEYPFEIEAWMLRGFLHELKDDYKQAAADLTSAIELNSREPHLFYSRGRYFFQLRDHVASVRDFSQGLALCDLYRNDYYREELHFWRAEALLHLGERAAALKDLTQVANDFASWTDKPRTKQNLLQDLEPEEYRNSTSPLSQSSLT